MRRIKWQQKKEKRKQSTHSNVLFTFTPKPKIFQDSPSHQIFRRMHEILNIDEKKTNRTVWSKFTR
jgi:hypothetical protein